MAKGRPKIPQDIHDELLFRNNHKCCICRKSGKIQIHHLDENPSNNTPENLLVACLNCHSGVHTERKMTKNFTVGELKRYKETWEVANVKKLTGETESSKCMAPTKLQVKKEFLEELEAIDFVSATKGKITLSDTFVWPEFSYSNLEKMEDRIE